MNFVEKLHQHLGFLKRSCEQFDDGHADEGLRMAVTLRVLLHDTQKSTSLFKHLGIKDSVKLLTTFEPGYKEDAATGTISVFIPVGVDSTGKRTAWLDAGFRRDFIPVRDWWEEVVMGTNTAPSRKDIVLAAANQDGGAHVDANPTAKTRELIRGIGRFGTIKGGVETMKELDNHHFYLIRQFAHEVLNSPDVLAI